MNAIKRLVKPLYYKLLDIQCVLQRTVFSYFHRLSIPINRHIKIESNVKFYNDTRVIYYDGNMKIGPNTEICCFSKFIIGGGRVKNRRKLPFGRIWNLQHFC